jgi:hypothetical protein
MNALTWTLFFYYAAVLTVVCVYGAHRYWLVWVFLRNRRRAVDATPPTPFEQLPAVTIQLPMFNERRLRDGLPS